MPACVPLDVTVDGMVDRDDRYENHYENHYDDGKQMDRLWRWTGLITAAKMGVRYNLLNTPAVSSVNLMIDTHLCKLHDTPVARFSHEVLFQEVNRSPGCCQGA